MAYSMVTVYGMNDKVGNVSYYDPAADNTFTKPYSEETGKMIDEEVRKMIEVAYVRTKDLLTERRNEVEILAKELLEKEVLFQSDVEALIGKRPYEDKKLLDDIAVHHHEQNGMSAPPEKTVIDTSSQVK
jgi:cell division protease FtsH